MSFINPSKQGTPFINAPHQWTSWVRHSRGAFIIRDGENYLCNCYSGSVKGHWSRPLLAWEGRSLLNQRSEAAVYYLALTLRMHISYQLLCNKLSQNIMAWKNNEHVLLHTVFMDQEFGSSLAAISGWRSLLRLWSRCQSLPRWLTQRLTLDLGQRPQSLATQISPSGCPSILITSRLVSQEQVIQERPGGNHNVFCDLASEVAVHHFCNIPQVTQARSFIVGRDYNRAWMPGSEIHWVHPGSGAFDSS